MFFKIIKQNYVVVFSAILCAYAYTSMNLFILFFSWAPFFYQSLKSSLMINEIEEYKTKIEFVILDKQLEIFLKKKGLKTNLFNNNLFSKYILFI